MKIGIITLYYGNNNYGGVLQAYALCKALKIAGKDAEQISFMTKEYIEDQNRQNGSIIRRIKSVLRKIIDFKLVKRAELFDKFRNEYIPHSPVVFTDKNIELANELYDCFITGSDQVWNMRWYEPRYFLDFVIDDKKKISYAASLGAEELSDNEAANMKKYLSKFDHLSVRESRALQLLKPIINKEIVQVLDPTLLLSAEQWDEICSPRMEEQPYLFCYYLSDRKDIRELAEQYAKLHALRLVTFPELVWKNKECDRKFGDARIYDAGPQAFISYIKHAECIFTDSFHAVAFSNIYNKQFVVFHRNDSGRMSSRLYSILNIFNNEARLCEDYTADKLSYIENVLSNNTSTVDISAEIERSMRFLLNSLSD